MLVYRVQWCQIAEVVLYTKVWVNDILYLFNLFIYYYYLFVREASGLCKCWIKKFQLYQLRAGFRIVDPARITMLNDEKFQISQTFQPDVQTYSA